MARVHQYFNQKIIIILSLIIIMQPIIDVAIGLSIRYEILMTVTSIIRLIILGFLFYWFYFFSNPSIRKKGLIILTIISVYFIIYLLSTQLSFYELRITLRTFYFPILFLMLYSIKETKKDFINSKYLLMSLGIYASVIVLGFITNTSFDSYLVAKTGTSGYFYAANDVGNIIAILLPLVFIYVFDKINIKKFIYFILILSSIFILGTKTPVISLLICIIYFIIKAINKNNVIKVAIFSLSSLLLLSLFITFTPIYKNVVIHASFLEIDNIKQLITEPKVFDHFFLGSRLTLLEADTQLFLDAPLQNKMFGIGYLDNPKLVEMDYPDILYRHGFMGFIIYFGSIIYLLAHQKRRVITKYKLPLILAFVIALMVGHAITEPAVSTFVVCLLCLFIKEDKNESKCHCSGI